MIQHIVNTLSYIEDRCGDLLAVRRKTRLLEIHVGGADRAHDIAAAIDPGELRAALIPPVRKHAVICT